MSRDPDADIGVSEHIVGRLRMRVTRAESGPISLLGFEGSAALHGVCSGLLLVEPGAVEFGTGQAVLAGPRALDARAVQASEVISIALPAEDAIPRIPLQGARIVDADATLLSGMFAFATAAVDGAAADARTGAEHVEALLRNMLRWVLLADRAAELRPAPSQLRMPPSP